MHLTVCTKNFVRLLKRAELDDLVVGFCHGHPGGYAEFSATDDDNERNLWRAASNRQGEPVSLASLLALPDDSFRGRVWTSAEVPTNARIRVNGASCALYGHPTLSESERCVLDRQARVFGQAFNDQLASLRVTVVGVGGTGSPLCLMLARAGVRHLAVIDPDLIELTNLHRLHMAMTSDVGVAKAHAVAREIDRLGLSVHCVPIVANVTDKVCRDALKASDLIFCATDDHAGRFFLNRFAYFYETLVIDMGLAVDIGDDRAVRDMTGRTTQLYPGAPCLICRRVVDPHRAREEQLRLTDPEAFRSLEEEGYVLGRGNPDPAFISMTTSVACMALEEAVQAYSEYRGAELSASQRLRRFHLLEDRRSGGIPDADCPICGTREVWARGDVVPFLDRVN